MLRQLPQRLDEPLILEPGRSPRRARWIAEAPDGEGDRVAGGGDGWCVDLKAEVTHGCVARVGGGVDGRLADQGVDGVEGFVDGEGVETLRDGEFKAPVLPRWG